MAQKTVVTLEDDLEGGAADETVEFSLDGKLHEIDLSSKNADKLREALAPFITAARRPGGRRRSSAPVASKTDREESQAARTWLQGHGYPVKDRGRIPSEYLDHYRTKEPNPPAGEKKPKKSNVVTFKAAG